MTSETQVLKTNEFLRRRKLRLQQVREQSKDIAKKIRHRANSENLRQIVDLDAKKQKEYFDRQENLVKRLEVLYARGLKNVGSGHHSAIDVTQEDVAINRDLSKLRGKEAAAALRKKRQEKLDEQKKLLDRKLQAREAANEISREKSSIVANKIITKTTGSNVSDDIAQKAASSAHIVQESNKHSESNNTEPVLINKNTIGTQWDADKMPQELEPTIPTLSLPIDNQGNLKDFEQEANKSEKSKRRDLFAVSKEMPSDLRGNQIDIPEIKDKIRPSLTLVSEYLQSRKLRLRDTEPTNTIKKRHTDDISSLKQTIFRTRTSKIEGPGRGSTCTDNLKPESVHNRKGSVLMYNHCTRDTRDLPHSDEQLVVRELQTTEDAYSQAITEASTAHETDRECQNKIQDMRNRMAVTKQTVEKEYKDTINFLNSMPKSNTANVTKTTYMDERRQQLQKENRQHKMQQEYRKIEKECRKHHTCMNKNHNKSKSPSKQSDSGDIFDNRDFQYSWMPVPEGDGNLAVHTIPNSMKESKNSNGVKFSNVDSYHEYRSRHKHTPPTKDTTDNEKRCNKKRVKTVIDKNNSTEESSTVSESSSVENSLLSPNRKVNKSDKIDSNLSDAERIIIYKILDTKNRKHCKERNKLLSDIVKSLTSIEKVQKSAIDNNGPSKKVHKQGEQLVNKSAGDSDKFENIDEGLYRVNEEKGDNLSAMHYRIENNEGVADVEETNNGVCRNENLREAQKRDKGTFLQWQDGDDDPREKKLPSKPTKSDPVPVLPSAATSTSSFKTATNDKANSAVTDGGFIKLLDETGHEAAKFFLGGTNLLKDDAYEVVIQLRKKDGSNKETNKLITEEIPKKPFNGNKSAENVQSNTLVERSVASENSVQTRPVADDLETVEVLAFRSFSEKGSKTVSPRMSYQGTQATKGKSTINQATSYQNDQKGSESSADIRLINSCKDQKEVADKGTTLQRDSSAIQFETASRPATTTYTQTTNSPIHRPIYFHMSSSTSTAYMSPPEIILPKYLKHDVDLTDIETLDLSSRHTNERFVKNQRYPRRNVNKNNIKNVYKSSKQQTPPNTAKNCVKHKHSSTHNLPCRKVLTSCKVARLDKRKCKCHNCCVNTPSKNNCKKQFHCDNNISDEMPRYARKKFAGASVNTKNKHCSTRSHYKRNNSTESLNPIVKKYINTLLSLNREGLKALEVVGQDCSSVATPSSSIINVPYNLAERNGSVENIISLEHIKKMLVQQVVDVHLKKRFNNINKAHIYKSLGKKTSQSKRKVHKVKSLNITKHLLTKNTTAQQKAKKQVSPSSLDDSTKTFLSSNTGRIQSQSRSSPTLRQSQSSRSLSTRRNDKDKNASKRVIKKNNSRNKEVPKEISPEQHLNKHRTKYPVHKATATDVSPEPTKETDDFYRNKIDTPVNMPTQTRQNIDSDLMKLAEDKLSNMEKIADLTEKCTKRLSNLARVLEEVRKNKSLVYNYISNSDSADSQSDDKSDRMTQSPVSTENIAVPNRLEFKSLEKIQLQIKSPEIPPLEIKTKESNSENNNVTVTEEGKTHSEYISFLTNIPKPTMFQLPGTKETTTEISDPITAISPLNTDISSIEFNKFRPKPPAALSRVHLKCGQDLIVPHELSTVLEVDSPMSVKNKNQSSRYDTHNTSSRSSTESKETLKTNEKTEVLQTRKGSHNPDLLQSNKEFSKHLKPSSNESSDDSKFQMIDLKHFNEIMLEPFITVHEYAKKYNVAAPDEGSNFDDLQKDDAINDDISSLRSDGSLPDVIAELLKRNVITEPFKFETASNVNSTTASSESTLSMLALTKARKNKKKSNVAFQNKENIGETTDTLSISSNPDLENAFKKLGMGWASSTLKKTKERLALSSSSNTSSSSLSQFKIKSFNRDIPALVTDSVSSVLLSQRDLQSKSIFENSKNTKKQTNFTNSMTVKEFLTNELANKITFTSNKSDINDTEEEFVSLFETKMPEGLKQQSQSNCDGPSNDSIPSGTNRARTSTPVQLFKSTTYQSSSCSNISNGLFSNADLSSVKMTSNSMKNHSTTDKDDLTIPNFSLKLKNSDCSKSD